MGCMCRRPVDCNKGEAFERFSELLSYTFRWINKSFSFVWTEGQEGNLFEFFLVLSCDDLRPYTLKNLLNSHFPKSLGFSSQFFFFQI